LGAEQVLMADVSMTNGMIVESTQGEHTAVCAVVEMQTTSLSGETVVGFLNSVMLESSLGEKRNDEETLTW